MQLSKNQLRIIDDVKNDTIKKIEARNSKLKFNEDAFNDCLNKLYEKHIDEFPSLDYILENIPLDDISEKIYFSMDQKSNRLDEFKFNNSHNCCLAPKSTLSFDTMGYMRVCCYNSTFILGTYPKDSISDAWNSSKRQLFIDKLQNKTFPSGCQGCEIQIKQNNISNGLFSSFDHYDKEVREDYPIALNFEFGTICNFECIMCGGKWSSSIRKNREKLPPLKSPYDDNFIDQAKPFIEKTLYVNFLGGEPFLNSLYYKIFTILMVKNKYVKGAITTNGSIFNDKIENYLKNLPNLGINISLDSLEEKTYQTIRKNGNYKTLLENIKKFKDMGKLTGIAVCPMIQNIHELPNLVQFAVDNKLALSLNTVFGHLGGKIKGIHENETENELVWGGLHNQSEKIGNVKNDFLIPEVALHTLPKDKLQEIVNYLKEFSFVCNFYDRYGDIYSDFIKSLEFYLSETPNA
jgi:MoaA/NifB/PqqE/SkfB family radical SAM enzyme